MMAFQNVFVMKGLLLSLKIFFLRGACILRRFMKTLQNEFNVFNSS